MSLVSTLSCEIEDIQYYMKYLVRKLESFLHVVSYWRRMIVGDDGR